MRAVIAHPRTIAAPAASAEPGARPHVPPGVILALACVANFMVIIDTSIVNVALPAMKASLGLSAADQQWVVDGYLITFGGFESGRYVLFINVPIGVALLTAAGASLVPSPAGLAGDGARLDLPGALTVTVGAGSLVYAVSQATIKGWGSTPVIAALAAAAVLLAAFAMIEARSAAPLVPLSILRRRSLAVGNTVMACLGVVMTSGFFFLSLYLQQILGYSALRTGAAIVPMTVLLAAGPLAAKRLLPRFGPRFLTLAGGILTTAGVAWLSLLPDHSDYPARIIGPMLVIGAGIGFSLLPLAASATTGIEPPYAGLASGLFNTARQLGGAIGLAVLVTIAATATRHSPLASPAAATVHGYRIALLICAAVGLASVLIALLLPTQPMKGTS